MLVELVSLNSYMYVHMGNAKISTELEPMLVQSYGNVLLSPHLMLASKASQLNKLY